MGGGGWDVGSYTRTNAANAAAGRKTFDYSDKVQSGQAKGVHNLLVPAQTAGPSSPFAGTVMREVCVTDEHPDPTALLIWLDVTGSNIAQATVVHAALPRLQKYLQNGNFCNDPQINVSAVGDANSDFYPLQFGQFESDNRLDDQIAALILEGAGGGQKRETYELGAYMAARHVHQEPLELYGKKGFCFFIGDEMPYRTIKQKYAEGYWSKDHTLESLTGDTIGEDIDTRAIFDELKQKYHVFFLFQQQGAYTAAEILPEWEHLLGEDNIVMLEDPSQVVEVIAALVARFQSGMNAVATSQAMLAAGGSKAAVTAAMGAIEKYRPQSDGSGGHLARTSGTVDLDDGGADRL